MPAPTRRARALVVECGQHFKQATSDLAVEVAQDFLGHFGLIDREVPPPASRRGASSCCART